MLKNVNASTIHLIIKAAVAYSVLLLAAGMVLAWHGDSTVAPILLSTAAGTPTALFALLAATHSNDKTDPPTPVQVANTEADPIPTTTQPATDVMPTTATTESE